MINTGGSDIINLGDSNIINTGGSDIINTGDSYIIDSGDSDIIKSGGSDIIKTGDSDLINTGGSDIINTGDSNSINTGGSDIINTGDSNNINTGGNDIIDIRDVSGYWQDILHLWCQGTLWCKWLFAGQLTFLISGCSLVLVVICRSVYISDIMVLSGVSGYWQISLHLWCQGTTLWCLWLFAGQLTSLISGYSLVLVVICGSVYISYIRVLSGVSGYLRVSLHLLYQGTLWC